MEAAIDLAGIVEHVLLPEFRARNESRPGAPQDKLRSLKNVDIILMRTLTEVKGDGSKVVGLEYRDLCQRIFTTSNWPVFSSRLVCCRTPTLAGKVQSNVLVWARLSCEMRNQRQRRIRSGATVRRFRTGRSSSPLAKVPKPLECF
ncbi:hypothetical protein ACLK1T_03880 [Escherichia coli]